MSFQENQISDLIDGGNLRLKKEQEITIKKLSHDIFYKMQKYSQIVIDYVEDVEDILNIDNLEQNNFEELGAIRYQISNLLNVINPILTEDIEMLNKLDFIISEVL